jgi:hypothetical protein
MSPSIGETIQELDIEQQQGKTLPESQLTEM